MQAPNVTVQSSSPAGKDAGKPELTNKITGSANQIQNLSPSKSVTENVQPHANTSSSSSSVTASSADRVTSAPAPNAVVGQTSPTVITVSDKSLIATNNLQPVQVTTPQTGTTPSQTVNVTIANQQYQFNLTVELQKLLQTTNKIMITADAVKAISLQKLSLETNSPHSMPNVSAAKPALAQNQLLQSPLVLLAQAIQIKLPASLTALATQNGVSTAQLSQLASRPQGYPLPNAVINKHQLTFVDGPTIKLDNVNLTKGQYLANIIKVDQRLVLTLTPIQAEVKVNLTPSTLMPDALANAKQESIVISKPEPSQLLNLLFKKLETSLIATELSVTTKTPSLTGSADNQQKLPPSSITNADAKSISGSDTIPKHKIDVSVAHKMAQDIAGSLKGPALTTESVKNLTKGLEHVSTGVVVENSKSSVANTHKENLAPMEVLQKALSKAGAMPLMIQKNIQQPQNLALELLKLLPQLAPQPLTTLTEPTHLLGELHSITSLNLAQSHTPTQAQLFSGGAITTLFQLMLGVRAQNSGKQISDKLQNHLQLLQRLTGKHTSGLGSLLGLLEKAGTLDSMSQLASSFQLYQQASSGNEQALNWYFSLPYSLNQRNEQFEGHFQKEDNNDADKPTNWRLQLKFNLSEGAVLIQAHKKDQVLDLKFKGNNQYLLDKITRFNSELSQKISQIGFTPGEFSTQIASIPATLLPGDHFLVKTRA
ncbi:hypothetical protein [Shewanella holmiensis]|uniref:Uncharacterized protein n=1 Tax=Shewanella holmiensis TaxID=2952222 RepID=A0A9X2WLK2_9GAMM|nr:hypothetical protein [Shewanella holmiensis]MCT7941602.1 hypothetical protein [Shewanella holmiensis]